jgi:hypothetical protein
MSTARMGIIQLSTNKINRAEINRSSTLFKRKKLFLVSTKLRAEKPLISFSAGMVNGAMSVEYLDMCFLVKGLGFKCSTVAGSIGLLL